LSALPAPDAITAAAEPPRPRSTVALLRVDAGLREAVPTDELDLAERVVVAPRRDLQPGSWSPEALVGDSARPFAALLLRGVVAHEMVLAGRCSANLLGPGDVFRPWRSIETALPCASRWTCASRAAIAVLDERFLTAARRWPGLSAVIHDRLGDQLDSGALRTAIVALPRVEQRILALFWQLADRWGTVAPGGVVVRLELTHAMVGHLVGAQRPTVTIALKALAEDGLLRRSGTGTWTLGHGSQDRVARAFDGPQGTDLDACRRSPPGYEVVTGTPSSSVGAAACA
jgi:CRP-like cAMP-binding protein